MKTFDLETSFIETIASSDLSALAPDVGEVVIDQLLDQGLLKDIPVVGSILKISKIGIDVKNYLFIKKLCQFLSHLHNIPPEKRQDFANRIEREEKHRRRVGENLLLLIDRLDDFQKPEMFGRIFKDYVEGSIDYNILRRLCSAVDKISIQSISDLITYYDDDTKLPVDYVLQDLAICGLVSIDPRKAYIGGGGGGYCKNDLGKLFIKHALKNA